MYGRLVLVLSAVAVCCGRNAANRGASPWLKLNDGREMPALGLGTWLGFTKGGGGRVEPTGDEVEKAVGWAIDAGYRHVDTAAIYDTEGQVGQAIANKIREGVVAREDLFITTKLWNDAHARDAVVPALKQSLKNLGLEYVDLYLIHWPVGLLANGTFDETDYLETWKGMVEAKTLGLAKSIGVSNFNRQQLDRLMALADQKPAVLQVELNLNLQQPELRTFCAQHDIAVTAYTPFGSLLPSRAAPDAPPPRITTPELVDIAKKHGKTVPQIALKYLVMLGAVPIPKSITKERIEQNIQLFDFELSAEDMAVLRGYDKGFHTILVKHWRDSPHYPFEKE